MYTLIEYSVNYLKLPGSLWQCCRDEPPINDPNGANVNFNIANAITNSFKLKQKTSKTGNDR